MKQRQLILTVLFTTTLFLVSGCGQTAFGSSSGDTASQKESSFTSSETGTSADDSTEADPAKNKIDGLLLSASDINFKDSDLYIDPAKIGHTTVTLSETSATVSGTGVNVDGSALTITSEGTYVLSGTLNGSITVDAPDEATVTLVLNDASITSDSTPAINVVNADKVILSLPDGTVNTVTDGSTREDETLDAAIYSTADLVLNGSGTLNIDSHFKDAIHGKDDVRIMEGTYTITSVDDGIVAKDRLEIKNGTFTIQTTGKGLKSTNTEDEGKGFIYIENGQFDITSDDDAIHAATAVWIVDGTVSVSSGDDGIHADETLTIDGGTIEVTKSVEGLEAAEIILNGGIIQITASDDGINAAGGNEETSGQSNDDGDISDMRRGGMTETSDGYLYVNGGTITVKADGDGLDANSSIYQTGGDLIIEGPTDNGNGYLDYADQYVMTGGTLFASGSTGMLQTISDSSSVNCLTILYDEQQTAGSTCSIRDADGSVILSYTPSKAYSGFTYASANLEDGQAYTVYAGETKLTDVTMDSSNKLLRQDGSEAEVRMGGAPGQQNGQLKGGEHPSGERFSGNPPASGERPEAPDQTEEPSNLQL